MTDFIIEASQLKKSFKSQHALRGLDLRVPQGSIFGFLGRNGAGKTTTLKILMGLLRSDGGSARVFAALACCRPRSRCSVHPRWDGRVAECTGFENRRR